MKVVEVRHPLVRHKLGKLRDARTDPVHFRQYAGEIAALLAYEATRDLPAEAVQVPTWAGPLAVDHVRGDKILVFKKWRRNDSRKLQGHRQDYTAILVKAIEA